MVRFLVAVVVLVLAAPTAAHAQLSVKGSVSFEGEPPERLKLRRDTDPYCARTDKLADDVIVTNGKLKDVLVRVKNGSLAGKAAAGKAAAGKAAAGKPAAPEPPPALIDQKDCTYTPRVIGLAPGQRIAVRNSDGTFHNVRGTIAGKQIWNKPAAPGDPELALDTPAKPGDVIDVVCDVHPWMHAYAVVQDSAVFAVTGDDGAFELRNLPPGTYTIEAWHPMLGTKSTTVKIGVGAKGPAAARFTYKRGDLK
jgi:plastocyanin